MGKRLTRLALEVILAVSVLALVTTPPNFLVPHQTIPTTKLQLPTLPQRLTFHSFWYYIHEWMRWLVESIPHTVQREWWSFTSALTPFEPLPPVNAVTVTRVQGNARGTARSSSAITVTQGSAPASGDVNIAVIGLWNSGSPISVTNISQNGVTWTKQVAESGYSSLDVEIWAGVVSSGASATITVNLSSTLSASNGGGVADVSEYSGLVTSSFLDRTAVNGGGAGVTGNTGTTATTSQVSELWIGGMFLVGTASGSQSSPLNGFTLLDGAESNATAGGWFVSVGYLEDIVSSTGTAQTGTTFPGSMAWDGCIATFLATTGPPPSDFTITASPSSQSIGAGGTAESALTVTFGGGFSSAVSLSITSGCPANVTCTVNPTSISTSGGTSTLTVPTIISTSGTYPVVVTATGGSKTHTVTFTVTVTTPPSFTFDVLSSTTQVVVTVTWVGTGTASVTITGPNGTPSYTEASAVVYDRISYISGSSPPTNVHRVTFTLSSPPAGIWTAYVSQSGATVTIEVS